jgi:hypothetical protein
MSDILSKDELKEFAGHQFFHDKIELLEKLKTRTRELLAMHVPMHSINVHSLRHYISLIPGGESDRGTLIIKVVSDVINGMNNKNITYSVMARFADFEIECVYFDEIFDQTMTEKLKELSGAIVAFSNRESNEIY